jgi:hypothetical protein
VNGRVPFKPDVGWDVEAPATPAVVGVLLLPLPACAPLTPLGLDAGVPAVFFVAGVP